ncbi:MAG: PIN domain-containing protein [Microcystis viridis Mv_BB_P_19951000_S69]|uniref:PIN domain-containing protein n=1 Tax=Microcystis viridis Mv_BB_P_19951000_S68D TaxID=2486270 RepID=A0A552I5W2_MICVR|nr:MAG: PIN domain-containing protein [Microcystis viridis Mv_BB_P_19951000_S68]TRU71818.1 MAG: PIN domain-containing protein [Microcystis viridis Mv_BB_P_19951000_S69]TRU78849.1 MAG: PIN domain-containing protein [Microcystis viridis Mv_BB_P_19951000_S68D]TRU80796.1 MAG: PIN domain-containing protein [Microcystis viridis Mv_BB_P_19951000_S69D]
MRKIFLDTSYLQALADFGDNLNPLATAMAARLGNFRGVTSEMVLTELLNALCSRGEFLRKSAIRLTHDLRNDSKTIIIPQTSEQFQQAFDFYQRRLDKGYSLTDCASMQIIRQLEIYEILTFDKHFQQEGFSALLRE